MKKLCLFLACFAFLGLTLLKAQNVQISGTITGADDGMPVPGASVQVKGTTIGTSTDANGKYSLNVPTSATTLVFSFVGMRTQELAIGGRTVIDVVMQYDALSLDEIVVVGYGIQTKREVSGSVATVKGENIKTIPVQTFDQALQGKAAGVNITIPNAVLGNPPVIRVRGINSISASSSPLIVVDGVPVFSGDQSRNAVALNILGDINPADIASIEVLKDASATAIYGSRASNGVILITTKRGSEGRVSVTYDASMGYSQPYNLFKLMNAEDYVTVKNLARANSIQANGSGLDPAYFLNVDANGKTIDTDWNDIVYRTGFQHNHALSVTGANSTTSYFLSAGYSSNDGIIQTNTYDRKSIRMNLEHKINKNITIGANSTYSNVFTNAPQTGSVPLANFATAGAGRLAFVTAPIVPVFLEDGSYNIDWNANRVGLLNNLQPVGFFHPQFLFDNNYNNAQSDRIIGNLFANVKILEGLYFRTVYGIDNNQIESKTFWHPDHGDGRTNGGEAFNYFDRRTRWNWTNTLNYNYTIAEKLNLRFLIGSEEQYSQYNGWSARLTGLSDPFFADYQGSFTTPQQPPIRLLSENYFLSAFGRINVDFDKKYYIEVSGRRDGFSGLAKGSKFGNFGGVSLMWNLSNESFIKNSAIGEKITDLRLKASWGKVGNISGVADFASLYLYNAATYNSNSALYFSQIGNADLGWETSNKIDVGLAFAILKDRLQFELGYYKNDIDGLMLNVPQSPSVGLPPLTETNPLVVGTLPMNVGKMYNKGFEFSLTSYNVNNKNFTWTTTLNFNTLKNEVTELAEGVPYILGITQLETTNRTLVGYPIGMIWGVETLGVDPETGRRMFVRHNTDGTTTTVYYNHSANQPTSGWRDGDGNVSRPVDINQDGVALGSPIPRFYGGIDNSFTYRGFDLNIGLTYALDFYVYNGSKAGLRDQRNWNNSKEVAETYWQQPGDVTDIPKPVWGDNVSNGSTMVQSQNVERGDYLKVRNLSLGYTYKHPKLTQVGVSSIRVYSQIFNALVLTGYSGSDPEISSMGDTNLCPGVDRNTVPQARTYSFGVNFTF